MRITRLVAQGCGAGCAPCGAAGEHPKGGVPLGRRFDIPLPASYGGSSLWQGGWWQVEYDVSSGNDTTTGQVNVLGNPVHLAVP